MSSEESYLAILRYLTNEREPYAPGTEGNAKRKIRKAAACYVVRGGTLYYQRRQRDQQRFAELEVVLQAERRDRLIRAAHLAPDGSHRTRLHTWQGLSQKYWWRGERGEEGAAGGAGVTVPAALGPWAGWWGARVSECPPRGGDCRLLSGCAVQRSVSKRSSGWHRKRQAWLCELQLWSANRPRAACSVAAF